MKDLASQLHAAMMFDRLRGDLSPPELRRIRCHLNRQADALLGPTRIDLDEERMANRLHKRRQWLFTFLDYQGASRRTIVPNGLSIPQ